MPFYPKRRYVPKKKSYGRVAHRVYGGTAPRRFNFVPRGPAARTNMLATDAKYFDIGGAGYAVDTTGSITHLDVIPQGNTVLTREGKSFRLKSVWVRGSIDNNTAANYNECLAMLVWDRQPNKALAAITDILDIASADAFTKRENAGRFRIVKKWSVSLAGYATTGYVPTMRIDEWTKLPAECVAICTNADTTGAIGNRLTGALLFVTVGSTAAGTGAAVMTVGFRLSFSEK